MKKRKDPRIERLKRRIKWLERQIGEWQRWQISVSMRERAGA